MPSGASRTQFVTAIVVLTINALFAVTSFLYNPSHASDSIDGFGLEVAMHPTQSASNNRSDSTEDPLATNTSPEESAGLMSTLTYSWLNPVLALSAQKSIGQKDLPRLSQVDETTRLCDALEANWTIQLEKSRYDPSAAIFSKALFATFGKSIVIAGIFKLLQDAFTLLTPVVLGLLIRFIQDESKPFWHGLMYALILGLITILQSITSHMHSFRITRVGQQMRASVSAMVYRKVLRMSFDAKKKYTTGELVSHQSVDTSRLDNTMPFLHMVWSGPLQVVVAFVLLFRIVSWSALAGLLVLILMVPTNVAITRVLATIQKTTAKHKDSRLKLVNEVLQGIRLIKYFAWEKRFEQHVDAARQLELNALRWGGKIRACMTFLFIVSPILVSLTIFSVYTLIGRTLTAEVAFPTLALINILRFPVNILPTVISSVVESRVAIGRFQILFSSADLDVSSVQSNLISPNAIVVNDGTFEWDLYKPVLENISINIPRGELVLITGTVGSGKSSLLSCLLGEMPKTSGSVEVNGQVSFCAQQAWMQNATIKDNIIFNSLVSEERYQSVLDVCELRDDLRALAAGDATMVGEKGVTLSGGQKQRISLARAIYQNSDIYLLDDPLSAVDAHVGNALFNNCILNYLQGKTRLLVTHQLQYASKADHIIVLSEGRICEQGSYSELINKTNGALYRMSLNVVASSSSIGTKKVAPLTRGTPNKPSVGGVVVKPTLLITEEKASGSVGWSVYKSYIGAIGGFVLAGLILSLFVLEYASKMSADWWLSVWSSAAHVTPQAHSMKYYLGIYAIASLVACVVIFIRSFLLMTGVLNAAAKIHRDMLRGVLRSPISWFDANPVGRILNRFSKDQYSADESLMRMMSMAIGTMLGVLSITVVVGAITPWLLVYVLPLAFLYRHVQQYYLKASLDLQRLNGASRSPIYATLSESLGGLTTIRGFDRCVDFIQSNENAIDENQKAHFLTTTASRWLGLRLEFIGTCVVFGVALFTIIDRHTVSAGLAGLAITYATQLTTQLNWMVKMSTDVQNEFVAIDRCIEYAKLIPEADAVIDPRPNDNWPSKGCIAFTNVVMRYRPSMPLVLKNVSFDILAQEKIGIVGRTGAGKSSLMNALLRIVELESGSISIDGVNCARIGLDDLRSRIAIIPQDPTLFSGTVRSNLDPLGRYGDAALWRALDGVQMSNQIRGMAKGLDSLVSEFGSNINVGSRQLLCMARAILMTPKILIMDEATASIDFKTDEAIQKTIREQFKEATVLTIAHRIATIADYDKILVLDAGEVAEFDSPLALIQDTKSIYAGLVTQSLSSHQASSSAPAKKPQRVDMM
jgi:ABC-type multidrug transport system fused ATPase/permease subunit